MDLHQKADQQEALLIVTCREPNQLDGLIGAQGAGGVSPRRPYLVRLDDFTPEEFRDVWQRWFTTEPPDVSQPSEAESTFGQPRLPAHIGLALRHPIVLGCFRTLNPEQRIRFLNNEPEPWGVLLGLYLDWFSVKVHRRLKLNLDTVKQILRAAASATLIDSKETTYQMDEHWVRPAERETGLTRPELRRVFNDAVTAGIVRADSERLSIESAASRPWRWRFIQLRVSVLTPEQARQFIQASGEYRLGPLFCTMLALGMRLGEALALRWDDVSLDYGTVQVTRALQRIELATGKSELQFVEPKSNRSYRVLAIPKSVVALLGKHRATQNRERLVAGSRWRSERLVFASTIGTPLDERNVRREFRALLETAKLPVMRIHDLRHSYATILLAAGEHPKVVQETLGHASVQLTLDTYSHLLPDMGLKERAAARLGALLTAPAQPLTEPILENPGQNPGQNSEEVVSRLGIEPRTRRLRVCCSAN